MESSSASTVEVEINKTIKRPKTARINPFPPVDVEIGRVIIKPDDSNEKYTVIKFLGSGTYSMCYAALHTNNNNNNNQGNWVAIKFIPTRNLIDNHTKMNVENEIKALTSIGNRNENIVKLIDHFQDDEFVYIILELCPGMSLSNFIKSKKYCPGTCSEARTRIYIGQLLSTLQFLKENNIVHRDIKLGNVLLNDSKTKIILADFGMAEEVKGPDQRLFLKCGTPHFVAPEVMHPQIVDNKGYSFEIDIWSVGICMYTMLVGKHPFRGEREKVYEQLKDPIIVFPSHVKISSRAQEVIKGILKGNPMERWSIQQVLEHPFFSKPRQSRSVPGFTY